MTSVLDPAGLRDWERQRDEPPAAWFAFKIWRDRTPTPTFTAVAEEANVAPATISKWAVDWSWKIRKAEYDRWLDAGATRAAAVNAETMAATHLTAAAEMRLAGLQALRKLVDALQDDPHSISASAAVRALAEAVKIERLTLGHATEITETQSDYSKHTDEEIAALDALLTKAETGL